MCKRGEMGTSAHCSAWIKCMHYAPQEKSLTTHSIPLAPSLISLNSLGFVVNKSQAPVSFFFVGHKKKETGA